MRAVRLALSLCFIALTAACAVETGAPPDEIARARHVSGEAPYIAVVSMVDNTDGRAAHSALVINASERVIYDPAGTFDHPDMPERGDIHYGADDRMISYYERYHARFSHHVHVQKIPVSPAVAEMALRRAQAQGPSPKMFCTVHTTEVLRDVPGFEGLRVSFFPEVLREQIAAFPGVENRYRYEQDIGQNVPTGES
ncbi:hypothetical protein HMH01_04475 [Halovulum dunhuangense]|uniref:Lipoprotein n=1 Tax=Halovulum dunhuangense TaxID=1505036 RepID=A0A849L0A6_9RHOB|nr:hypothetical protein [Halovulum dunhuangense]NNU79691.1 hypothetical protein [Halovulum dunhuangense]